MINCRTERAKGAFGNTFNKYILTSTNHDKIVTVTSKTEFKNGKLVTIDGFNAKNENNGSRFEANTYPEILERLTKKGW